MFRYKNLPAAFSFQIIWCVAWIITIFSYGYKGFIFAAILGALRPLILKMETAQAEERPWKNVLPYTIICSNHYVLLNYLFLYNLYIPIIT